jgi:hypothetical protein
MRGRGRYAVVRHQTGVPAGRRVGCAPGALTAWVFVKRGSVGKASTVAARGRPPWRLVIAVASAVG